MARRRFDLQFSRVYRPIKMAVSAVTLKDFSQQPLSPFEVFVIVTLVDSMNNQVFRQDIACSRGQHSLNVGDDALCWEASPASVKVPCTNANVHVLFTVVAVTSKPTEINATIGNHVEFIGQAEASLHDCVLHSRFLCSDLPLGSCKVEPIDAATGSTGALSAISKCKVFNIWRPPSATGHIAVRVEPCSHLTSRCGFANELAGLNEKTPSKKVFIILDESFLRFQTNPIDPKPRYIRLLSYAAVKLHKHGVIEVKAGGEWCHLFTFKNSDDAKKWHAIFRGAIARSVGRRKSSLLRNSIKVAGSLHKE
jgi:hypothetical protein